MIYVKLSKLIILIGLNEVPNSLTNPPQIVNSLPLKW